MAQDKVVYCDELENDELVDEDVGTEDEMSEAEERSEGTTSEYEFSDVEDVGSEYEEDETSDREQSSKKKVPKKIETHEIDDDLDDSDEDESDDDSDEDEFGTPDDYFKKIDDDMRHEVLEKYHPELKTLNYDEIQALTRVVRNEKGEIIDPLHTTIPFLTKYEKARLIGERAVQLNNGAQPMIEVPEDVIDGYLIALMELEKKKIPFIIKRPLPSGACEYWKLQDLEVL